MLDSVDVASIRQRPGGLRGALRHRLLQRAFDRAGDLDDALLERPTVVLAPHFDDETLGCGGTLLRGKRLGAERHIIFMTDGSVSHRDWTDAEALARDRRAEGYAAAAALGIAAEQVTCLDYPETALFTHLADAVVRVQAVLRQVRPGLVLLPYRHEPPADHRATYEVGIRALQTLAPPFDVLEYPIWVWDTWPFTTFPWRPLRRLHRRVQENWRLVRWTLRDLGTRVDIRAVRSEKLAALQQHRTQMVRPPQHADWPVLADVKNGDFLDLFFAPYELFHRTTVRSPRPLTNPPEEA